MKHNVQCVGVQSNMCGNVRGIEEKMCSVQSSAAMCADWNWALRERQPCRSLLAPRPKIRHCLNAAVRRLSTKIATEQKNSRMFPLRCLSLPAACLFKPKQETRSKLQLLLINIGSSNLDAIPDICQFRYTLAIRPVKSTPKQSKRAKIGQNIAFPMLKGTSPPF